MTGENIENKSVRPSEMSEEKLPDVRAFQDKFTRRFMKSAEEGCKSNQIEINGSSIFLLDEHRLNESISRK